MTFIQLSNFDYDWMIQRPQQLMKEISKKNNIVYFIEKNQGFHIIQKEKYLYVLGGAFNINKLSLKSPVVLWCSSPDQIKYVDKIPHDFLIYDIVDEAANELAKWKIYVDSMLRKANLVFTASQMLYEKYLKRHKKVFLIKNGVDLENFSLNHSEFPLDMPRGKKIVGYTGALAAWLDFDIIEYISRENSLNLVLIGPLLKGVKKVVLKDNIFYAGLKDYKMLPYYINNFDVCILPFKINTLTMFSSPIKLYEYLSLGKATVSTGLNEALNIENLCYIGYDKEDFYKKLQLALREKNEQLVQDRIAFASQNTWESRAEEILQILVNEI